MQTLYKILLPLLALPAMGHAQQRVSDGTVSAPLNANALLQLQSTNKGLLLPRVALDTVSSPSPLGAHVAGMYLYNTSTTRSKEQAPYINDGTKWLRTLQDGAPAYVSENRIIGPTGTLPLNTSTLIEFQNDNLPNASHTQRPLPATGRYLVIVRLAFTAGSGGLPNGVKNFYIESLLDGVSVAFDETRAYCMGSAFSTEYTRVISATKGQTISFKINPTSHSIAFPGGGTDIDIVYLGE